MSDYRVLVSATPADMPKSRSQLKWKVIKSYHYLYPHLGLTAQVISSTEWCGRLETK